MNWVNNQHHFQILFLIFFNYLGDDTSFLKNNSKNNNGLQNLNFLDFTYDLIPREFVSAVITEKGFLPCTSVPAILRFRDSIYNNQTL